MQFVVVNEDWRPTMLFWTKDLAREWMEEQQCPETWEVVERTDDRIVWSTR